MILIDFQYQAPVNFSRNRIRWILLFIVRYPVFEGFYPAIFFLIYRRDGIGIFFLISLMTAHRIIILISFHFRLLCIYIYAVIFQYYKDKEDRSFFKIRVYGNYAYVIPLSMHFSF